MKEHIAYLKELAATGGPSEADYAHLDDCFKSIDKYCLSNGGYDCLKLIWPSLGDAFTGDTMQGHGIRKPFGYNGDFLMIDRIYTKWITQNHNLERWDYYFQSRPACIAVRARKRLFTRILNELIPARKSRHEQIRVLDFGSGPSRIIYEYIRENPNVPVSFVCADKDTRALA